MRKKLLPVLFAAFITAFSLPFLAPPAEAAIMSCTPDAPKNSIQPPALKTPVQFVLQLTTTMPITGIMPCRDVYGLRLGNSYKNAAVNSAGLDIGIPFSSSKKTTGIQLSLIRSSSNSVTGLQLGGIYNHSTNLKGIQIATMVNRISTTNDSSYGMQAGFINVSRDKLHGLQIGFINLSAKTELQIGAVSSADEGIIQASVIANVVGERYNEVNESVFIQLGGVIANYAPKVRLFQGISSANIANELTGMQLGVANIAYDNLTGIQLGVLNIASRELLRREKNDAKLTEAAGVQIGLINMADSIRGLQIGLVNSAVSLKGVQIGALNINHSGALKFMPLINIGF